MVLPMETKKGYQKLIVYQKAKQLILETYSLTSNFPREELYVLIPQMRRAVISIAANVVEGYSKNSRKEFSRFLNICIGSASELEVYFEISLELKYFDKIKFEKAMSLLTEVKKLLYSFQKSLKGGLSKK